MSWPSKPCLTTVPVAPGPLTTDMLGNDAGPGVDDSYVDVRSDYVKNAVAVDYNAGYTGVLAALSGSSNTWAACVAGGYTLATWAT